jgi:hypothetical protein
VHPQLIFTTAELYKALYQYVLSRPTVAELTVEDPAEAFEDLRDRNDLKMLLSNERFMQEGFGQDAISHGGGKVGGKRIGKTKAHSRGKMGPPADKAWAEKWRIGLKIAGVSLGYDHDVFVLEVIAFLIATIQPAGRDAHFIAPGPG